jgi:RND family efflux transporter MFP subunit
MSVSKQLRVWLVASIAPLALVACSENEQSAPPPASRPVKLFLVEGGSENAVRTFPGRVDAAQRAELSFRVPGRLQEILVKEGSAVQKGQVLARLDASDYEIILEDRQAAYDNASRNFKRARDLVDQGNISRTDFDNMEAQSRSASAALSQAKKDLEYTVLQAPFSGRIAQRAVENFEEVQAKQTVFWLHNIDLLDVIIDLPESVVRSVSVNVPGDVSLGDSPKLKPLQAWATFEGRPDQKFVLTPREITTKADSQTRTYRATFTMQAPTNFAVLPGMSTSVELDLSTLLGQSSAKWVPVRAVQADSGLQPRVWLLDPASMTVAPREVAIGRMAGDMIEITAGLTGGEEVVAVGAPYLAEGMRVSRMEMTEQAQPRPGDPS